MNPFTYMEDRTFSKGRDYLGASDALTLSGMNPYQTPLELWEVLTGRAEPFKGNRKTKAGERQEHVILAEYVAGITGAPSDYNRFMISRMEERTTFKKFRSWTEFVSPDNPKIKCHPDLLDLTYEAPFLIQAKNRGIFAAKRKDDPNFGYDPVDFSENGVPLSDYFQEQIEMLVSGIPEAYIAVQVEGWDNRLYGPVGYSKKTAEQLYAAYLRMLWHVDKDEPPTPQTWSDVVKLNPEFKPKTKAVVSDEAEIDCRMMLEEYPKLVQKIKEAERRENDITNAVGLYIGPNQYLETPDGHCLASAAEIKSQERISLKKLRKYPEIMALIEKEEDLITRDEPRRQLYLKGVTLGVIDTYTLLTTDDGEKWKRSRKKYSAAEKKDASALLKSLKIDCKWEKI